MSRDKKSLLFAISTLGVPLLTYIAPNWLSIAGINPFWAVLWLLPWSLTYGTLSGVFLGLCLGLILDAITLGDITHLPSLILLGFLWGKLGEKGILIEGIFNLGFLAWLGTAFIGITIWAQQLILHIDSSIGLFNLSSFHKIFTQSLLTGILSPIVCSWLLLKFGERRSQ